MIRIDMTLFCNLNINNNLRFSILNRTALLNISTLEMNEFD